MWRSFIFAWICLLPSVVLAQYSPPPNSFPPGPLGQPGPYGLQPAQPYFYGYPGFDGYQPDSRPSLQPMRPESEVYAEERFQRHQEQLDDLSRSFREPAPSYLPPPHESFPNY